MLKHFQRVKAEAQMLSSHFGAVELNENDYWIYIARFDLPPGFSKRYTRLLIDLPQAYPEYPVNKFYIDSGLKKNHVKPEHYFEKDYVSKELRKSGFAWFCIHLKEWNPHPQSIIKGDNMLTAVDTLYKALKAV